MSLDVGNKFNVFSPTHDSKLVTRLQHVTHAVWAVSRVADNNRMWHISGASSAAQWWMSLLVCLPSASRTGTYRLISMGSWPWRRQKIWIWSVACAEIEGEIANEHVSALRTVTNMQWSLMRSFMVTFPSDSDEISWRGRGDSRENRCGRREGGNAQARRLQPTQRIQLRIGSRLAKHFVQWFAQRGPTLFALTETTCPPMGEIASQKTNRTTAVGAELSSKKNGFQLMSKLLLS